MADETRALAEFTASLGYERIPHDMRAAAIDILVDQLGCQISGSEMPWAQQVRNTYIRSAGAAEATVARYGDRVSCATAAFINSTFGHSFEFDDINPRIHGHPGAELVPALLALSESRGIPGKRFLAALVAGYEVRGRIGWALSPDMIERGGPQYSTTCGPFGVAAGAAVLMGMGADGVRNALGIAGGYAGGLMQYGLGGGSVKRIYTAIAASNGLQAACLAEAGLTGPEGILEGERGLLRIFGKAYRPDRLVSNLGTQWMLEGRGFKPYCCCGAIHPAIDGLQQIIAHNALTPDDIVAIDIGYPTGTHLHAAITEPRDMLQMQFSTSYSLALTVLKGGNAPRHYTNAALSDPALRAFAAKVKVREDTELGGLDEGMQPGRVTVSTRHGKHYEALVVHPRGTPGAPLSSAEIDDKFRSQVFNLTGDGAGEKLLHTLRSIDTLDNMAQLGPMLVCSPTTGHGGQKQ
jgi:2-methylcitrate dehydratase PrpD